MMDAFGDRQQELMKLLLRQKNGLTIDELAEALEITRTAVRQHLAALERGGYVEPGEMQATGGRPSQSYKLTTKGYDLFPKQYSWFSEVLLDAIQNEKGRQGLREFMGELGKSVSFGLNKRVEDKSRSERVAETVKIMNELAYEAQAEGPGAIEATNCVYHAVARKYPEVCQFDLELLARLTDSKVIHEKCIAKGGNVCRFRLEAAAKKKK